MKKIIPFVYILFTTINILSCSGSVLTAEHERPAVKDYDLPKEAFYEWSSIKDKWLKEEFLKTVSEFKLKMNCAECGYIFINVILEIDGSGKLAGYKKIRENVCGGPAPEGLEKKFIDYFKGITFPDGLRDIKIEVNLGNGLKC